jgi:putative Mg2+ transporter-C (MgtC) family protein
MRRFEVQAFVPEGLHDLLIPFVLRMTLAGICGALIGLERELRGKAAGFRTYMLICLGSAMFMVLSQQVALTARPGAFSDPGRIAAQVVTGIGFLGAGAIIQSGGAVRGLTSAAMIWTCAAVGLTAGAGYLQLALVATGMTLGITMVLARVERTFLGRCEEVPCELVLSSMDDALRRRLEGLLREHDVSLDRLRVSRQESAVTVSFDYCKRHGHHREVLGNVWRLPGVLEVRSLG